MSLIIDGTTGVTFNDSSLQGAAASPYVLKNRIINGAMVIDQRNAGASVTPTETQYTLDRWQSRLSAASKYTVQQNAGSVTPPVGFTNYLGVTSSSAYSVSAGDYFAQQHNIEGYNIADLAWGTVNAKTITLSFWVRSSLTGTFGGCAENGSANRSYPFTYTISSANTWEQKSVTIAGDTSGTWNTTTSAGIVVFIGLGVGTTYSGTAGSWSSNNYVSATGATSVVGTSGATFYITGVQLEQNTVATPFERRLYNQELANCQRYFSMSYSYGITPATASAYTGPIHYGVTSTSSGRNNCQFIFPVTMRANPTVTIYSPQTGTSGKTRDAISSVDYTSAAYDIGYTGGMNQIDSTGFALGDNMQFHWAATAEL